MNNRIKKKSSIEQYDVAICGGGLAGLTLARQIKLQQPERSIVLIERVSQPLPEATHKVGESSVELGANYLGEKLQLSDYFAQQHYKKMGLRYFFGDSTGPLENRPEFGLSGFPTVDSYQIDRGKFETDLRQFNAESGVKLIEGKRVKEICFGGDKPHKITLEPASRAAQAPKTSTNQETIYARWVIDAMGRRRYLQKKLNLTKKTNGKCSAAWFRLAGRIDIEDLVSPQTAWHDRVPGRQRYFSTNHLMGDGYWVWLIPLATGYTSVGIVAQESIHPFETFNTHERAFNWLRKNEPRLADYLQPYPPLDFKCIRRYSYSSKQIFSEERWACVGEAALFPDPFYSPGINLIGFTNSMTTEMIRLDFEGQLTSDLVAEYNRFCIGMNDALTTNIQSGYPFFGNEVAMAGKLLWDNSAAWTLDCPLMFNSIYLNPEKNAVFRQATRRFFSLTQRMQRLFVEWSSKSSGQLTYEFLDYLALDFLREWRLRNLQSNKSCAEISADMQYNMDRFEELAQVIFLLAIEDVMPDYLAYFPDPLWINAWRVGLDPDRWEKDRLFHPTSAPRDLTAMREQIRRRFYVKKEQAQTSGIKV